MPLYDIRRTGNRPRPVVSDLEENCYLTDGRRLYRVVDRDGDAALLENCRVPEEQPGWERLPLLLNGHYEVVRAAP